MLSVLAIIIIIIWLKFSNHFNMRFHKRYFIYTVLLFLIEVLIAIYINDAIIRPYGGDFLVVILLYYFVRTFFKFSPLHVAIGVLLFSYAIEILQYFKLVNLLGLQDIELARIIIGTGFSWWDMLAYTLGIIVVYWLDYRNE